MLVLEQIGMESFTIKVAMELWQGGHFTANQGINWYKPLAVQLLKSYKLVTVEEVRIFVATVLSVLFQGI